jgi:phospholipid/cholesterol/gamma-HCH transport system substrate-binding protein
MMATLQGNNKNLLDITNDLKVVSKALAEGKGTIGKLLNDPTINNTFAKYHGIPEQGRATMRRCSHQIFLHFSKKLNNEGYLLNDLATDTTIVASLSKRLHNSTRYLKVRMQL